MRSASSSVPTQDSCLSSSNSGIEDEDRGVPSVAIAEEAPPVTVSRAGADWVEPSKLLVSCPVGSRSIVVDAEFCATPGSR